MEIDGEALRAIREKDGHSVKSFATTVGISLKYLSDIELGRRKLTRNPALIKRMAEALNVPVSTIERRGEPEAVGS